MPSSATITSTDFTTFASGTRIRSAPMNTNFSVYRGHLLPVDPNTSAAAATGTYDLGSSDHKWRTVYAENIVPSGSVMPYAGSTEPTGWLFCYGQAVSRTTYATLFGVVSTTYGTGDGSTTFNLPDLRGRAVGGRDDMGGAAASRITVAGAGITATALGAAGGAQTHTLVSGEMPSHTHVQDSHSHTVTAPQSYDEGAVSTTDQDWARIPVSTATNSQTPTNQNTGGGGAHNNTQPTIILNYIIKT